MESQTYVYIQPLLREKKLDLWVGNIYSHNNIRTTLTGACQGVYSFAVVERSWCGTHGPNKLFALAKYECCCCLEEPPWIAVLVNGRLQYVSIVGRARNDVAGFRTGH
jgi:hypothetical protein